MTERGVQPRFKAVVLIPVYNHASTVGVMVKAVRSSGVRCLLVDDGSDPACAAVLTRLALLHGSAVTLIRLPENLGKGGAVMRGLREAARQGYSHVLQIDADGQHDTGDVGRFLANARRRPEAVICGYPQFDSSAPRLRRLARYMTHLWVWINTLSFDIRDSMCGLRVYPTAVTVGVIDSDQLPERMAFDVEILVRLHWQGVRVVNLRTRVVYPSNGVSHFRPGLDNALLVAMHTRLFFGMLRRLPMLLRRKAASTNAQTAKVGP